MNQSEKAKRFTQLHVKGAPLLLYNAWDAGSAQSVLVAGAKAIATSSWSVAAAQGYQDGEAIPIEFAEQIVGRIATSVDAPVTVDFEGGYSEDDSELADNISRLIDLGVIGAIACFAGRNEIFRLDDASALVQPIEHGIERLGRH